MGDPRKARKQYKTPGHPWQKARIDEEKSLIKEFGFANKKEIWKVHTTMIDFKARAKKLISAIGEKGNEERKTLISKLNRMGILSETATIEDVLGLSFRDFAERRLQSLVLRKGLARSVKQARQFIVHEHIKVNGKKINAPSYVVLKEEEETIVFSEKSNLFDEAHPERAIEKKESVVEKAAPVGESNE